MSEFDPSTQKYILPDAERVTLQKLMQKAATSASGVQVPDQTLHVRGVLFNPYLAEGTVIRYIIEKRTVRPNNRHIKQLHYAALFAGGEWYLTGAGEWYGTNVLTKEQMFEVLQRDECVEAHLSEQWMSLDRL